MTLLPFAKLNISFIVHGFDTKVVGVRDNAILYINWKLLIIPCLYSAAYNIGVVHPAIIKPSSTPQSSLHNPKAASNIYCSTDLQKYIYVMFAFWRVKKVRWVEHKVDSIATIYVTVFYHHIQLVICTGRGCYTITIDVKHCNIFIFLLQMTVIWNWSWQKLGYLGNPDSLVN